MSWRASVYDNQTAILQWLKSLGHQVEDLRESDLTLPEDRKRRRACESKRRFDTPEAALALQPSHHVYKCPYCVGYHLTTPRARSSTVEHRPLTPGVGGSNPPASASRR